MNRARSELHKSNSISSGPVESFSKATLNWILAC